MSLPQHNSIDPTTKKHSRTTRTKSYPSDLCLFVGRPETPRSKQAALSLCLSSHFCLSSSPDYVYKPSSPLAQSTCRVTGTNLIAHHSNTVNHTYGYDSCAAMQHERVVCRHGEKFNFNKVVCPTVDEDHHDGDDGSFWFEDITIIVPKYPYLRNIYHSGGLASTVFHVANELPNLLSQWGTHNVQDAHGNEYPFERQNNNAVVVKKINIFFRMSSKSTWVTDWAKGLWNALVEHELKKKYDIKLHFEYEDGDSTSTSSSTSVCFRNAVVLGMIRTIFVNATDMPVDGFSVNEESVRFRRAVWNALGIKGVLPGEEGLADLPPFVVGYSERNPTMTENGCFVSGNARRFSDENKAWFTTMLREETAAMGAKLKVFKITGSETFEQQVKLLDGVGFLVGVHGANLVNAIFMKPFGALLEVTPWGADMLCYIAGSNAGLAYYKHEATVNHSIEESRCPPNRAMRNRLVGIDTKEDREQLRNYVREGMRHLKELREKYADGIPTRLNTDTRRFEIER